MARLWGAGTLLGPAVIAALIGCGGDAEQAPAAAATDATAPVSSPAQQAGPGAAAGPVLEVVNRDIGGSGKYEFDPSELSFDVGETVTFRVTSETEFHTFTVDDLGIDLGLEAGETVELDFTFEEAGTFDLVCLSHPQMTGTIMVQ